MKAVTRILGGCILAAVIGAGCGGSGSTATTEATTHGGEERIEQFGREAAGAERAAILGSFHGYLSGLASKNYGAACAALAREVQRSLEGLASPRLRSAGCSAILPRLLAAGAGSIARAQLMGAVRKVRLEGDRAFVVFHAPGAELYMLPMTREGGGWKVALLIASVLVPLAAR